MLRESERRYLELIRPRYENKPKPVKIRKRDADIRLKAKKAFEYLKYLAEKLSDDQHEQVFNEETVKPLIEAIFKRYRVKWEKNDDRLIYNVRLFRLAVSLANLCLNRAVWLINPDLRMLVNKRGKMRLFPEDTDISLITALYYSSKL